MSQSINNKKVLEMITNTLYTEMRWRLTLRHDGRRYSRDFTCSHGTRVGRCVDELDLGSKV